MSINSSLRSKPAIVLIIVCGVSFIAAAFLAKAFVPPKQKSQQPSQAAKRTNILFREGFDFNRIRSEENEWRGPIFGERIDLAQLRGADNVTRPDIRNTQLLMIVVVSPECGLCKVATDETRYVRDQIKPLGIPYYVVSFVPSDNPTGFFEYCDSLRLGVPEFLWTKEQPLTSLSTMVIPSHLLLDRNGVIVRTWPGSNDDKTFRVRMGNQIVADTNVITDTLETLSQKSNTITDRKK